MAAWDDFIARMFASNPDAMKGVLGAATAASGPQGILGGAGQVMLPPAMPGGQPSILDASMPQLPGQNSPAPNMYAPNMNLPGGSISPQFAQNNIMADIGQQRLGFSLPQLAPPTLQGQNMAPHADDTGDFWSRKNSDGTQDILGGLLRYDPKKDLSGDNRMGLIGATFADAGASLGGHPEAAKNVQAFRDYQTKLAGRKALSEILNGIGGQSALPAIPPALAAPPRLGDSAPAQLPQLPPSGSNPGFASGPLTAPPAQPTAPPPGGDFSLRALAPKLAALAAQGVDVSPVVAILKDMGPKDMDHTPHEGINPTTGKKGLFVFGQDNRPQWLDVGVPAKAPTTRTVRRGTQEITQEWDDNAAGWKDVATGVAFKPDTPDAAGWTVVNDPTTNQPYRYNSRTAQATDLNGKPIAVGGYGKIATNNPRSAVGIYMEQWKEEHPKASSAEIATAMNTFSGQQAEQHALGTIGARVGSANNGLDRVLDQANEAYAKLGRTGFVPFNKLQQMATTNAFSTPEQADAYAADTGAINMWAKAINSSGVLTVENARRGSEMLSQAQSPEAHAAVIARMRKEGAASVAGVNQSRGIMAPPTGLPQLPPKSLPRLPGGTSRGVKWKVIGQ